MKPNEQTAEEQFVAWLAACDEALAAGSGPTQVGGSPPPGTGSRLAGDLACLRLLAQLRPGHHPAASANPASAMPEEDLRLGTQLGKYQLLSRLGQGGMGVVYQAEDTLLQRRVALKLLPGAVSSDSQSLRRFLLEAQAAARLNHPNVVTVHEVDQRNGEYYIVMELVPGGSAQAFLQVNGPFPWPVATWVVAAACRGLVAAHAAGLIHRDIKPANILLAADGGVKLGDFGLAKSIDRPAPGLTADGSVLGTPDYMSPEQCSAGPLDGRSDVYSLGATYYALLTGKPPFSGEATLDVLLAHRSQAVPDPRAVRPDVPLDCAALVKRAMAKMPAERFQSAGEMLAALERVVESGPEAKTPRENLAPFPAVETTKAPGLSTKGPSRIRLGWWSAVVVLAAVAALIGVVGYSRIGADRRPTSRESPPGVATGPFAGRITPTGLTLPMDAPAGPVAFSPDGRWFAAARTEGKGGVRVWDWATGKSVTDLWPGQGIASLAFSPDGNILAAAGAAGPDGPIKLWHAANGPLPNLAVPAGQGRAVAFSPKPGETRLAAAIELDKQITVQVWDGAGKLLMRQSPAHPRGLAALAFSPHGQRLASGGSDNTVKVWDLDSGNLIKELKVAAGVRSLAFSRLDEKLVVDMANGIDVWHCGTWKGDRPDEEPKEERGWNCVTISRDGVLAVHGGWQDEVLIYNITTREPSFLKVRHGGDIWGVALSADGRFLATGSADGTVKLWDVSAYRAQRPE